ncbi:MAG: MFS transporter [Phycisphaerales bacterium]
MSSRTRSDLRAITLDGGAFSLMVGLGEAYVPAFALAVGLSDVLAGWVVSIPLVIGASLQLISPQAVRLLGSHRRWVLICAVVQALTMIMYAAAAWLGAIPAPLLFMIAAIYWGAGLATGPAWNTWVGSLIPSRIRPRFFAQRARLAQICVLAGLIAGGLLLQYGAAHDRVLDAFAIMFLAAGIARLVSCVLLGSQSEPAPLPEGLRTIRIDQWIKRLGRGPDGKLLRYLLIVQVAVQISGPFFTPYMLSELELSYVLYLILISTSFLAKSLVSPFVGSLVRRFGPHVMMLVGGVGIVPLAALWTISDSFGFLLCVQLFSGSLWAVYELCTFLLLFEHIDETERTSMLTTFNFAHAVATVCGALLGGLLLKWLAGNAAAYRTLFAVSSAARCVSVIYLLRLGNYHFSPRELFVRTLAVRPNIGSLSAPIVAAFDRTAARASLLQQRLRRRR